MTKKERIQRDIKIELSRRNFYEYCKVKDPKFYKKNRKYLKELCDGFQSFIESDDTLLCVNCPPRFGKSYTLTLLESFLLGLNPKTRIISVSYNTMLSTQFSRGVRDIINEPKLDLNNKQIVYKDIFNTKIKKGDGSVEKWAVEGSSLKNFIAASPKSSLTGYGADYLIIDDLIKNSEEAFNSNVLDSHWNWFRDTFLSRAEAKNKMILVFTRWAKGDLSGRLTAFYDEQGLPYRTITMKAEQEDGSSLCEDILPASRIKFLKAIMSEEIFNANYNQVPMDLKGRLYKRFNIYKESEIFRRDEEENFIYDFDKMINYTDTADRGEDYLCSITAGIKDNKIYLIDIIYTKAAMEYTEIEVAEHLNKFKPSICRIESNNGGRSFARQVDKISKELNNDITQITSFHQSDRKDTRILSNKENIMNYIYYPEGWSTKWEDFFRDITEYQAEGKNAHDDAPDALTGIYETFEKLGYYKYK